MNNVQAGKPFYYFPRSARNAWKMGTTAIILFVLSQQSPSQQPARVEIQRGQGSFQPNISQSITVSNNQVSATAVNGMPYSVGYKKGDASHTLTLPDLEVSTRLR